MTRQEIYRDKQKINHLITQYSLFSENYRMISHWTMYLCIRISGYLEQSIQRTLIEYVSNKSHDNVTRYAHIKLKQFQNAKTGKIIEQFALFNVQWSEDLRGYIDDEIKSSINGIVNTRHQIAHGVDSHLTPSNLKKYYANINKFLDYLWDFINP